jgi:hypothetical protein
MKAMEIVCSWKSLFQYAGRLGQARVAYRAAPTEANAEAVALAEKAHDDYVQMCLQADRMVHFPDISPEALRARR